MQSLLGEARVPRRPKPTPAAAALAVRRLSARRGRVPGYTHGLGSMTLPQCVGTPWNRYDSPPNIAGSAV